MSNANMEPEVDYKIEVYTILFYSLFYKYIVYLFDWIFDIIR